MSNRELTAGYEFPKKPVWAVMTVFALAGFTTLFWLLAAFVLLFGPGVAMGLLDAGDTQLPSAGALIGYSIGISAALLLLGYLFRWLARKIARPYWPIAIP